jgi:archaellum biogenesis ATPase FlaH
VHNDALYIKTRRKKSEKKKKLAATVKKNPSVLEYSIIINNKSNCGVRLTLKIFFPTNHVLKTISIIRQQKTPRIFSNLKIFKVS